MLALFIPLIMSSGGNSGSQATSLIIRALALREIKLKRLVAHRLARTARRAHTRRDPRRDRRRAHRSCGSPGLYDYGTLLAAGRADGRSCARRHRDVRIDGGIDAAVCAEETGFDPASASAPFVATLVDVTGLVIYFTVAFLILRGTVL